MPKYTPTPPGSWNKFHGELKVEEGGGAYHLGAVSAAQQAFIATAPRS